MLDIWSSSSLFIIYVKDISLGCTPAIKRIVQFFPWQIDILRKEPSFVEVKALVEDFDAGIHQA